MMGLSDGVKSLTIYLPVLTECTNVTDTHTDRRTPHVGKLAALDANIARKKMEDRSTVCCKMVH